MRDVIQEKDWKLFRELRTVALERFCERVLAEMQRIADDRTRSWHERYLAIYRLIDEREGELAAAFNDPRRSRAVEQLSRMRFHELLRDEEMKRFGEQTRKTVELLLRLCRRPQS
jgi:hypothetical protein